MKDWLDSEEILRGIMEIPSLGKFLKGQIIYSIEAHVIFKILTRDIIFIFFKSFIDDCIYIYIFNLHSVSQHDCRF